MRKLHVLVTAGPTREKLDPVRFLSNLSTGEMGYAIARAAKRLGHAVTLISGPSALQPPQGVRLIPIESVMDLKRAMACAWPKVDVLIMTAAVCDYEPIRYSGRKIKRVAYQTIRLKRTPDLLKIFSQKKGKRVLIGFCLETEQVEGNARRKLKEKNLDLIVANWLSQQNNPFGDRKFSMAVLGANGRKRICRDVTKKRAADVILKEMTEIVTSRDLKKS